MLFLVFELSIPTTNSVIKSRKIAMPKNDPTENSISLIKERMKNKQLNILLVQSHRKSELKSTPDLGTRTDPSPQIKF